jgi:hypothetical protein
MLNSLGLFSLVYRLQLWSIRSTIHLQNDDSWLNPPLCRVGRRTHKKRNGNLPTADAALAPGPVLLASSRSGRFVSDLREEEGSLLPDQCTAGDYLLKAIYAMQLLLRFLLVRFPLVNFALAAPDG